MKDTDWKINPVDLSIPEEEDEEVPEGCCCKDCDFQNDCYPEGSIKFFN